MNKQLVKILIQSCINTYHGLHGTVKKVLEDVQEFKVEHTEFQIGKYKDYIIVAFQGSHGYADWFDNLNFKKLHLNNGIKIHEGFFDQYITILSTLYVELQKFDLKKIIFTGHSLGGALATLASIFYKNDFYYERLEVFCVTFGSPRVGNRKFAKNFNDYVDVSLRYVNGEDSVTKVPMTWRTPLFGFKHVATKNKIGQKLSWKEIILWPIRKILGNPLDHYPQRYLKNL